VARILVFVLISCAIATLPFRAAHADYPVTFISATCDPGGGYFRFESFSLDDEETSFGWKTNQTIKFNDGGYSTVMSMTQWQANPIQCELEYANSEGQHHHAIIVKSTNHNFGTLEPCESTENATLNIILDGKTIFGKDSMNGEFCSSKTVSIEFTEAYLFYCTTDNLYGSNPGSSEYNNSPYEFSKKLNSLTSIPEDCQQYNINAADMAAWTKHHQSGAP